MGLSIVAIDGLHKNITCCSQLASVFGCSDCTLLAVFGLVGTFSCICKKGLRMIIRRNLQFYGRRNSVRSLKYS